MNIREALYTARMTRRTRPDAIPPDMPTRILDAVIRAPKRLTRSTGIFWSSLIPNASPRERSI